MFMSKIKVWLTAFRLRTLPLAFSSILMGSFLAVEQGSFKWEIFSLAILTTLFLQILSNLANDYGDTVNGADHDGRQGPQRMVQSGAISLKQMKMAIFIFIALSLVSGIALIYLAFGSFLTLKFVLFLLLGIGAIVAALRYTMGRNPYGYKGLGDLYVLLFFGLAGVSGAYLLYGGEWTYLILLPSLSIGYISAGVLNVNNMRDIISDKEAGKETLVVKLGLEKAKVYHFSLIILAILSLVVYVVVSEGQWSRLVFLAILPILFKHLNAIAKANDSKDFDPQLKKLALSNLILVVLYGAGLLIGHYA